MSKECCDQIHPDDGRDDDGEERRKNDWGSHKRADRIFNDEISDTRIKVADVFQRRLDKYKLEENKEIPPKADS